MRYIKQSIDHQPEPDKSIGKILIQFYETMKALESDPERSDKQATKIVMTITDILLLKREKYIKVANIYHKVEQTDCGYIICSPGLEELPQNSELISLDN
jgi:hypothetical protein